MRKFVLIAVAQLCLLITPAHACPESSNSPLAQAHLSVSDVAMNYLTIPKSSEGGPSSLVTTIGLLKNTADIPFSKITVEVKYFDAQKNMIDTTTQSLYTVIVPAQGTASFKIEDYTARPKSDYASQELRIMSAETPIRKNPESASESLVGVVLAWLPMVIFIGMLGYFLKKAAGKTSYSAKLVAHYEEQTTVMKSHNELLARIATALENKQK